MTTELFFRSAISYIIHLAIIVICIFTITIFSKSVIAADLIGVVSSGELGDGDAGKLIKINPETAMVTQIGDTGLRGLSSLAFDHKEKRLIAGTSSGQIYIINYDTGDTNKIVDRLISDKTPPDDIIFLGFSDLRSLDFNPITGMLFGVVGDHFGDYLVRLDLDKIDSSQQLEFDIVGVIGSNNFAYSNAPIGFANVFGMAFDITTGELFGAGVNYSDTSPHPFLIDISTTSDNIPIAIAVDQRTDEIRSFPRAMAYFDDQLYSTGYRQLSNSSIEHVLFTFDMSTGEDIVIGPLKVDGQVSGLALVTKLPTLPARAPQITSFSPNGGNCGVPVIIEGSGFTANGESNVASVTFLTTHSLDEIQAVGEPVVISDTELQIIAPVIKGILPPQAQTAWIKVETFTDTTGDGTPDSTLSSEVFTREILNLSEDQSQGISVSLDYPLVAGKDTLFQIIPYTFHPGSAVKFETAGLNITSPNGDIYSIPATFYSNLIVNTDPWTLSEREQINFYVSGDLLNQGGTYKLEYKIEGDSRCASPDDVISISSEATFLQRRGDLRILFVLGAVHDNGQLILPDDSSMKSIPKILDEFSRTYPVANEVSRLGQDISAGVRYDISSMAVVLSEDGLGSVNIGAGIAGSFCSFSWLGIDSLFCQVERAVYPLLDRYNEENFDNARFTMVLVADEMRSGGILGRTRRGANVCMSILRDSTEKNVAKTPIHEVGHDFWLGHTSHCLFPPNEDPRNVRAFDLSSRKALKRLPASIMAQTKLCPGNLSDGEHFFLKDNYEVVYEWLLSASKISKRVFTVSAGIIDDDIIEVIQSYESFSDKQVTEVDSGSPYSIVFLSPSGKILAQNPFSVSFMGIEDDGFTSDRFSFFTVVRPIPDNTAEVQLRKETKIMDRIKRTEQFPNIELIYPIGGEFFEIDDEIIIRWTAFDPDTSNEELRFNVSYSTDGLHWVPIVAGINETSVTWQAQLAAGSTTSSIKITATDGFNSISKESEFFTVKPKPPIVSILRPKDNQVFLIYDSIAFEGLALDLEQGIIDDENLKWNSNIDGELGTGRRLNPKQGSLAAGIHTILLTVKDGDSTVTDDVTITILADTDRDGLSDDFENKFESQNSDDPYDAGQDIDDDGLSSSQEDFYGTNPKDPDTDGDGKTDGEEIALGNNPTNIPPIADAGPDKKVAAGVDCKGIVVLDGRGSTDPEDCQLYSYIWSGPFFEGGGFLTGDSPSVTLPLGIHTITLTVYDCEGESDSDIVKVIVEDKTPPTIEKAFASPGILWPPNHKMKPITVTAEVLDNCDPEPVCQITLVESNESENGLGDGNTEPDWEITGDLTVDLRDERSGTIKEDRIYTITVECTDFSGNSSTATVEVVVKHDQEEKNQSSKGKGNNQATYNSIRWMLENESIFMINPITQGYGIFPAFSPVRQRPFSPNYYMVPGYLLGNNWGLNMNYYNLYRNPISGSYFKSWPFDKLE